ncbi:MAG TPA: carboxypeptidase regulatory-like domain-containing protein [Candidatus Aquilonibacter sp.]|nr:carboxypeptidase regulatory-like domain-containing protein [Candidatus Aquilonibacter sp.]
MKKILASVLLLASSAFAFGQAISTNGGSIQGSVTDPSGAKIPGAQIVISDPAIGYSHTLTSDSAGFYSVGPLTPGTYTITFTAPNFQRVKETTEVRTGTVTNGSVKLTIGTESETVEVNAGQLQVNTDQIGVSGVITSQQIETMPVNGRNILDVASLEPGVILQTGESFDPTKAGYSAISVDGVGGRTTRILLDGQDITDETVGTTLFNVPLGAVNDLQLNRSTQDVSGEVTSTGQVLLTTRSGTNTLHGNVFYNFQDNHAGFANVNGVDAPFQRNQFGGYVGGAILKDKLFFYGGGERILQHEQDAAQSPDPTFNEIIALYPLVPAPFKDTFSMARLDYNGPHGIHFFVRGAYSVNADAATFGFIPYSIYENRDNVPAIVGGADMSSGHFTHSFRVGYEKFHNILGDMTNSLSGSIYNPSTGPNNQVTLYGSFYAGPNYLAPQTTYQSDKQFRYDGTWTHGAHTVKFGYDMNRLQNGGGAEFFGASLFTVLEEAPSNVAATCASSNPLGGLQPDGTCPNDPYNGYVAAQYIFGNGNSLFSERPGFGLSGGDNPSWRFGAYLADTWKVSPSFTMTAGLRWSVDTDRANQDLPTPLCSTVDPSLQFAGCTGNQPLFNFYGSTTGAGSAGYGAIGYRTHQPYGDFGPQVGFVLSPGDHKTSIRGGIGIYYESDIFNNTGNARGEVIQQNGAYFNDGAMNQGASSVFLPGLGSVTGIMANGTPCTTGEGCTPISTISNEAIAVAAPHLNALKAYYQSQVAGKAGSNPSYIGTGDGLFANNIYAGPYKTPYSIQYNGGVQRELSRGIILSVDYLHNSTLKVPLSVDVNRDGAANTLNTTAAENAIAATTSSYKCAGGYSAAAINCAIVAGATINDFAGNGLDSGASYFGGASASAYGLTPATGAAFPGINPNVGEGLFILPIGRSGYDAAQIVLQEQKSHPMPGLVSSNMQVSYSFSRIVTSTGAPNSLSTSVSDQFFGGARPWDNDDPNRYMGRNPIDHLNELSFGGSLGVKYGLQLGLVGHFFSAPPASLTLDSLGGGTGAIFQTDVDGDGTYGDLVPGTNPGYYMHQIKGGAQLNQLINTYNQSHAGALTPAGQALVSAGLFSTSQLSALGAVQQPLAPAPTNAILNAAFRSFDMNASYPISLSHVREGVSITPGIAFYNVFNMSNFSGFGGELLNVNDAGSPGFLNGPLNYNGVPVQNSNRVERASGTFDAGGPRTTEFQLKVNF